MKKYLVYFLFCLTGFSYAQDQLFKRDNTKIDVKILEINQSEIKYKLFTYQDGPTIIISKKDVALIIYQNGVHEVINSTVENPPVQVITQPMVVYSEYRSPKINQDSIKAAEMKELLSTKNLISMNILDPINGSFSVNYIREFAFNYLHVYVPISVGFAAPYFTQLSNSLFSGNNNNFNTFSSSYSVSEFQYSNKTYEVGLGLHFQSSGNNIITHFVGPYIGQAQFSGTYNSTVHTYDANYGFKSEAPTSHNFTMDRLYLMLDNGVLFRVTKNFNIMLLAGIGKHIDTFRDKDLTKALNYRERAIPINAFKFGVNFGYRF